MKTRASTGTRDRGTTSRAKPSGAVRPQVTGLERIERDDLRDPGPAEAMPARHRAAAPARAWPGAAWRRARRATLAALLLLGALPSPSHATLMMVQGSLVPVNRNPSFAVVVGQPDLILPQSATSRAEHAFRQFDPTLGTLAAVTVNIAQTLGAHDFSAYVECPGGNCGASLASSYTHRLGVPSGDGFRNFAASAGDLQFCTGIGSCTATNAPILDVISATLTLTDAGDLEPYLGVGTVRLPFDYTANLASSFTATGASRAGLLVSNPSDSVLSHVTLTYAYLDNAPAPPQPPGPVAVPEPATLALLGLGFAAMVCASRSARGGTARRRGAGCSRGPGAMAA